MRGEKKLGSRGFGLIEILVATAISAILALAFASMFQMMSASSNNLKGSLGAQSLVSTLVQVTSPLTWPNGNSACLNNLLPGYTVFNAAQAGTPTGMPMGFMASDGVSQIFAGPTPTPLTNYNVSVTNLIFENAVLVSTNPVTNDSLYLGNLEVGLLKLAAPNKVVAGGQALPETWVEFLTVQVDINNNIINCYNVPTTAQTACSSLGGTYQVGATPPCQMPYPCASAGPNFVFMGYDVSNNPICTPSAALAADSCATNGQTVASNGTSWGCQ